MRLTDKNKIKELATLQKHEVVMTKNDYKELKLGQLEDVEEELGIDLTTLFKALKNGIKAKWENDEIVELTILGGCQLCFNEKCFDLIDYNGKEWFYYFKDYGKTWALDKNDLIKEELE